MEYSSSHQLSLWPIHQLPKTMHISSFTSKSIDNTLKSEKFKIRTIKKYPRGSLGVHLHMILALNLNHPYPPSDRPASHGPLASFSWTIEIHQDCTLGPDELFS